MTSLQTDVDRQAGILAMVDDALTRNGGCRDWQEFKAGEIQSIRDLALKAARLNLHAIDLSGDLHVAYSIQMPVPREPHPQGLVLADRGVFDLSYQESWRWESPPGWAPLGLWEPFDVFHPNCKPALRGAICLGHLQPGIRVRELILLGYYALTLQDHILDETDPTGVLNPDACEYYRAHPEYLPLTRAGLLDPWEGGK